jgi:hypothetical protein
MNMKNNISKVSIVTLLATLIIVLLNGCYEDLDVAPIDPNVISSENVYQTPDDYLGGLAKCYTCLLLSGLQGPHGDPDFQGFDEGFSTYMRSWWNAQQISSDETVSRGDIAAGLPEFNFHTWGATNSYLGILHSRIIYFATTCNEFIRMATGSNFSDVDAMIPEARFLRAMAYWHALDLFGTAPFVTESDKPGAFFPPRADSLQLFEYIESELIDITTGGEKSVVLQDAPYIYGRANKVAAYMLLAKLYMNAEAYIKQDHYAEALAALENVINGPYELAEIQRQNFVADNNNSPEIIFPLMFDGAQTQSWGGATYLIAGALGGGSIPAHDTVGLNAQWGIVRCLPTLVNLFEAGDVRALFWSDGQSLEINDPSLFSDGYISIKFSNKKLDGSFSDSDQGTHPDTDFPMFRLADAYLLYAEAVVRGGGGSMSDAVDYVNDLRERASASTISQNDLTLDFLLDERSRELYWEGHRRTDLIRFGQFTSGTHVWPWKGNVKEGKPTESFRDRYSIPASQLNANPNLIQNEGY